MKSRIALTCICIVSITLLFNIAWLNLGFAQDLPSLSWRTRTEMPTPRGQTAVVTGDNGLIYVMSGYDGVSEYSTVEAYDPLVGRWFTKSPMLEATRGSAVARGLDGIIYVISGYRADYLDSVQAYNVTSDTWSVMTPIPNAAWMSGAATGDNGNIYIFGGESSYPFYSNRTQIYDPEADTWTNGTDMPTGRLGLGVVKASDGLIYTIGGFNGTALTVVEAYNATNDTWITKAPMPVAKHEFGTVLGPDGRIYVIGGGTNYGNNIGPFFNSIEIYDPRTDTWMIPDWSDSLMPTARKELSAALGVDGRIYALGGANGMYIGTNEEASITLPELPEPPENVPPTAYIDSIEPNPITEGRLMWFAGHGEDSDGHIKSYRWRSSIDGVIGTNPSFSTDMLSLGVHTIYFRVEDNNNTWSNEVMATVTVNMNYTEDPIYQAVDELKDENAELESKVDELNATIEDLQTRLDVMTVELLAAGIVTIVLIVVAIAVIYLTRYKKPPSTQTRL